MLQMTNMRNDIARLWKDRGGNFGLMTALIAVPVCLSAGMALDYTHAVSQKTRLQDIADAAALAGGSIFTGENLPEARRKAEDYIKAHLGTAIDEVEHTITADGRTLIVSLSRAVPTSLMRIASIDTVDVGVKSAALSPLKPTRVNFKPEGAQGWYWKKITILVTREGSTKETSLGTVTYQPLTRDNGGQGTMIVEPEGMIDLGKYTKLALQMDIKYDSCPPGTAVSMQANNVVQCNASTKDADQKYNNTLRSDDINTSHHLFVDGKQLPEGVIQPLESYFGCGDPQSHAWEDGGGFERQDFFYTVSSDCTAVDGDYVRLTQ